MLFANSLLVRADLIGEGGISLEGSMSHVGM